MIQLKLSRRLGAVLAGTIALAVAVLPALPSASAHGDPTIIVRLLDVRPKPPAGVQLVVSDGDSTQLALANRTATPMFVFDPDGRPFLRVSTAGVLGDVESPYLRPQMGVVDAATAVRMDCCPGRWMRLSAKSAWAWPDPRLDPPLRGAQGSVGSDRGLGSLQGNQPLATWKISLRYGDQLMTATGDVESRQFLGQLRTTVDVVPDGLEANVIEGNPPQLRLVIENGSTVDVLGADGREFLRMTPSGNLARVASREYQNHMRALLLPPATGTAETPLGEPGKAAWADARLTYSGELPKDIGTKPVRLGRWRIPVIVNGRSAEIAGEQIWDPITPGTGTTSAARPSTHPALYLVAAALTLIPLGAYVIARRRAGKTQM